MNFIKFAIMKVLNGIFLQCNYLLYLMHFSCELQSSMTLNYFWYSIYNLCIVSVYYSKK